jgi:hypothetical protein
MRSPTFRATQFAEASASQSKPISRGGRTGMLRRTSRWHLGAVLAALVIVVGGCAALRKANVEPQEQLLSAAGFQMKLADTPQKLEYLQAFTPQKLLRGTWNGKLMFVYADSEFCKCLYVGDEQAYQKYQQLAAQQKAAQEQLNAAAENAVGGGAAAPMDLGLWSVP